jgi:hypothetical protein
VLDEVLDGQEKGAERILDNIDTKHGCSSDWNRVSIDASESLLVN